MQKEALSLKMRVERMFRTTDGYRPTKRENKGFPNGGSNQRSGRKEGLLPNSVLFMAAKRSNGSEKGRGPSICVGV